MCFFHLKSNIRHQKTPQIGRLPKIEYEQVSNEIKELHMCLNKNKVKNLKIKFENGNIKWKY